MPSKGGISIDAIIYYLALVDRDRFVVVSFDIRSEEFNMIQVPKLHEDAPVDTPDLTLLELGGKATLCDPTNLRDKGVLALWTLEDVGSKKWSSKSLVLKPSQLPLVDSITFRVKGTTQNGKVFLIPKDFLSPFHILSYDMQNNDMRKIEIKGIPDVWFNMYEEADLHFDVMFMDQSESPIYIDFLSCFDWGDGD
ncbi:F-box/LRR-repeat protein At2g40920-like [Brassica napus]|uniref:F-box/LRR-repeat protein At2g40920-like n=1 Tax=Brassica napus TaxID=3708 RepID=UPI0006AA7AEF|nr:F-box/LRR-repeat protein At2g40920-like [Brassica napus]